MTGQQFVNRLVRYMDKANNLPSPITSTIAAYDGKNVLTLNDSTGATNSWTGGIVQLGAPYWDSVIIGGNINNTINLYSHFDPQVIPPVGTPVTLTGAPMSTTDWKGYNRQAVDYEVSNGITSFGTIMLSTIREGIGGLNRDVLTSGGHSIKRKYVASIFLEVPEIVADSAGQSMLAAMMLPNLLEQTMFQLRQFVAPPNPGFNFDDVNEYAEVTLEYSYQREGGPKVNVVGIMFKVNYRR